MTIKDMHYDFKQKLNKIDSQQYRNLKVPEIDWKLREGLDMFIKLIAEPKAKSVLGFEVNQRVIEDIRPIVVNRQPLVLTPYGVADFLAAIPTAYNYYVSTDSVTLKKGECIANAEKVYVRQHDDDFRVSPFDKSSFEWREVNITFFDGGIRVHTDGTFTVTDFKLNYIKKHPLMHNAQDYTAGTYNMPDGTILTGTQGCILPEHVHREIVDLAVLLTTVDLQIPDFEAKKIRIGMNQINQ